MQRPQPETIALDDVVITQELSRRSPHAANLQAENQAMRVLAQQMVNAPEVMLQNLVEMAVNLCQASSAGVSLLETTIDGSEVFRWNVLAGTLAQYVGGTTPRDFSPCGVCLERGAPVLFSHPERYFTYFQAANTSIVESLVLPLIAGDRVFGTIWIMSDDEQRQFDAEDVRVMTTLADFAATALLLNRRQTKELLAANATLEAEIAARKQAEEKMRLAQRRLELSLIGADLGVWTYNVGTDEFWADDRAKLFHGHEPHEVHNFAAARANIHPQDRDRALAAFAQAIQERSKLQIEYRAICKGGSIRAIASYAEFIPSERGEGIFYGVVQDISDRKFAEASLYESEARSRALLENLPGGAVFVVDRDLRYLLAEGKALSVAGFKSEDLVGRTIFEALPPELAANYEVLYRQALAGESFEFEHNAHNRTYISCGTPLRAENGEIYAVLAVSYDVSDRKLAEAALQESEERLRLFVTASSDIIYRMSADWREMYILVGKNFLSSTENSSQTWMEIYIPQAEQPRVWAAIQNAIRTKSKFELEHRVIQQDGAIGWTFSRAIPMLNEQGDIVEWFGAASDVTERKRSEEALRESEERFGTLANTAPALIWYNDAQGNNRFLNQYFLDFTGKSAEQIRGEGWHNLIHPDDAELYIADYLAAVREQRYAVRQATPTWHNRNRIRRHDGVWRWHDNYAQPLFNADGVYLGHVGVTIDNTDAIEAEEALRESEAKYRSLFETVDEGFCIMELALGERGQVVDILYREANAAFEQHAGFGNVVGKRATEIFPQIEQHWLDALTRVYQTGVPERTEGHNADAERWFTLQYSRVGGAGSPFVAAMFNDITDRKRRELNTAFLNEIGKDLSVLFAPDEIIQTVGTRLGEFLQASGCIFADVDEAKNEATIHHGWNTADVASLKQTFRLADYFGEEFLRAGRAGEAVIVRNTAQDERANAEAYARLKIGSFVTVPFQRDGRWTANITVTTREPRDWRSDEIELLQEIVNRVFPRIERARAEAALRESEEKYAALFASSPVPFMVLAPNPPDFTITAANEAYFAATLTTPEGLIGRRLFDVFPNDPNRPGTLGSEAIALSLDRVLRSRRPDVMDRMRFDIVTPDGGFEPHWWLAINAPLLDASSEVTAIIHQVTRVTELHFAEEAERENQERQAFLLKLSDILQRFVQPNDIKAAAMRLLGEHLGVSRAQYHECDSNGEYYSADGVGYTNGLPLLDLKYRIDNFGTFVNEDFAAGRAYRIDDLTVDPRVSAEERDAYRTYQIKAGAGVPLIRGGKLVAILAIHDVHPHHWTDLEMDLIRETAERIWTPVERARVQEALRESEEKYRSLFTTMDQGFCIIEKVETLAGQPSDFRYLTVNPAFERHTGMHNVVGRTIRELVPDAEQRTMDFYDEVVQTGQPQQFEDYISALDVWIAAEVFPAQQPSQIAVLFSNISERKRAEIQLHRAAEMDAFRVKLSDALRSIADPLAIQREASRILRMHLGATRVVYAEMNEDDVTCKALAEDVAEGVFSFMGQTISWNDFDAPGLKTFNEGHLISREDLQTTEDLTPAQKANFAATSIRAVMGAPLVKSGRLVAFFLVHFDVPHKPAPNEIILLEETVDRTWAAVERARAEKALRESELQRVQEQSEREQERQRAESLAELDRAKTTFFSNISHEFRTPLTLLLAPLQDALSDSVDPLSPPQRERLELAHRNANRLLKLVNTLLDFSRIEAGRMKAVYEPTDLAMFTTELASVFRSAIERAGLRLIVNCPPLPELVYVDREMWEKIVLNLLSNAFKFTLEGEITVRQYPADSDRIKLQIQDTGMGIAPEELPRLFERFYQVRRAASRTHEGSGIGLALVQELIKMHGGTVEVSSTVGQGTCFTVTIPLGTAYLPSDRLHRVVGDRITATRTQASTAISAAPYVEEVERWLPAEAASVEFSVLSSQLEENSSTQNSKLFTRNSQTARVLLVDDNADMRDYLTRILSEYVQVEAVADGAAALAAAQVQVPDLVLSDVMMPGLDGFELLRALRADPQTREIPIILLSARAGEESVVSGLEAGADDYLIKPFSAQELVSRVNAHLQMAQLRGEALRFERTTSRRKDELLSTVSHELNTPLVAILGWTRLLRSSPTNQSMLMKSLDTIERNATLQAGLIQDLLDMSRISVGKLRLNLQPVELESVIENAIAAVKTAAIAKDIHLQWKSTVREPHVVVLGDGDRLGQVICNLLTNAIKFTPNSGSVTVELSAIDEDGNSPHASYAQIRVTDTGIGIAAEFLPHVFDRLSQAEGSNSAKGLGLGLAIARHLVELHNGTIHAKSLGAGQGATFTVKLPISPE